MSVLPFLLIFVVPALTALGALARGWWTLAVPVFVFVVVPLLDRLVGDNLRNPREELRGVELERFAERPAFRLVLHAYALVQFAVTALVLAVVATDARSLGVFEWVALAVSVGVCNGAIGITVAHELIHRRSRVEVGFGVALLLSVCYPHFRIEHVQGHHANVATTNDPATARCGQSVYAFWRQSVGGSLRSPWEIERRRLERMGRAMLSPHNRMLRYLALELVILGAIGIVFGAVGVLFFLLQSLVAFSLLEIVNYVEHYGLERAHDGHRFERVGAVHSWDSPRRLTNYLLVNLQRHADHHTGPQHRYHVLSRTPAAPQLPGGYAEMVLLALVPRLWFRTIDPLIPPAANNFGGTP